MAEEVRQVEHYSASIPNKPGEGARILGMLRDAGVNLTAFWGYSRGAGRAQFEFIPEDGGAFVAAAKRAKLRLSKKGTAYFICGDDRPGAVADMLGKLAAANIHVVALQAACAGAGRYGAVVFVPPQAARKAGNILGAAK